jgi:hypothetical protein
MNAPTPPREPAPHIVIVTGNNNRIVTGTSPDPQQPTPQSNGIVGSIIKAIAGSALADWIRHAA